jgi:hypothetical protein
MINDDYDDADFNDADYDDYNDDNDVLIRHRLIFHQSRQSINHYNDF